MEMSHMAPRKLLVTSCWSWYLSGRRGCQCDSRGRGRDLGATGGGFPPGTPAQGGSGCSRAAGAAPGCHGSPGTRASCETGNKDEQHGRMPHSNSDCTISGKEKKKKYIHMHKIRAKTQQRGLLLSVRPVTTSQSLRLRPRCHVARRQELSDGRNRCGAPALTQKGLDLQTSWLESTGQSLPAHLDPQGLVLWPELLCEWTDVRAPCSGCFAEVVTVVTHAQAPSPEHQQR